MIKILTPAAGLVLASLLPGQLVFGNLTFPAGSQLTATTWNGQPAITCTWLPPAAPFVTMTPGTPGQRVQLQLEAAGFLHPPGYPGPIACITTMWRGVPYGIFPVGFWANAYVTSNPAFYPHGPYAPLWEEGVYNLAYGLPLFPPFPCALTSGGTAARPDVAVMVFTASLW